ncbi:unnamed protein product [Penicillium crustosum]
MTVSTHSLPVAETENPPNWVPILEQPLFKARKLRLVCIGAGFSGLILAHKIKHEWKMEDVIDLQIYEKNPDLGGTWYENRYPGAACEEIWEYMKDTAIKWDLEKFVSFNSRVNETVWDDDKGKWQVKVAKEDETMQDECDVLINASGFLK